MDRHIRIKHNADRSTNDAISSISRMADRLTDFNSVNSLVTPQISINSFVEKSKNLEFPKNLEVSEKTDIAQGPIDDEDEDMDETEINVEEEDSWIFTIKLFI